MWILILSLVINNTPSVTTAGGFASAELCKTAGKTVIDNWTVEYGSRIHGTYTCVLGSPAQ